MTNEELAALAAIEAKMTAGPWQRWIGHASVFVDVKVNQLCLIKSDGGQVCECETDMEVSVQDMKNAHGIAASRNAFSSLIEQARAANELRDEVAELQKQVKLLPLLRQGAKWSGELFCWALQNLKGFPEMDSTANDEYKRRLLNEEKLQAEVAALKAELVRLQGIIDGAFAMVRGIPIDPDWKQQHDALLKLTEALRGSYDR